MNDEDITTEVFQINESGDDMSDFQFQPLWGDPPKSRVGKPNQTALAIAAFMALLETAPGRWAELSPLANEQGHPPSRATFIKKNYPRAELETRSINGTKNRRRIWVRVKVQVPDVVSANGTQQERRDRAAESIG